MSATALGAMALPVSLATPAEAKTPGSTYCYHGTCHRVKTIAETKALVGVEETITASHYDDCSRDRFNPCGLTSSGERFHPDRADNTASPIYPDGTTLLLWNPDTERALVVRVNNAGPYWGNRKLDLSRAAAEKLGFEGRGVAKLRVRVVKAPEPEEAKYVRNRNYPPVPGDIGNYDSLAQAETGMAVAMALQATAASPLAPVTTANAFNRSDEDAEPLVAEAPQVFGRRNLQLASLLPQPQPVETFSLGLTNPHQSHRRQLASLSVGQLPIQSRWSVDELKMRRNSSVDVGIAFDKLKESAEASTVASLAPDALPEGTPAAVKPVQVASVDDMVPAALPSGKPHAPDAVDAATAKVLPESKADTKRALKLASVEPEAKAEAKPEPKRVARRDDDDEAPSTRSSRRKASSHRQGHSQGRRIARSAGRHSRERYAYAPRERWERPERTAGQLMSLGIRAQASSTM